jgi:hypothetical protein
MCLFESSTSFEQLYAHPQEDNCINTTSGVVTLVLVAVRYTGRPLTHTDYTRSCIHTIVLLRTSTELLETCKGKVHPCTGTEALYRPYGPYGEEMYSSALS